MKKYHKFLYALLIMGILLPLSSCLESDEFDGLTDSRPQVAVVFPGREYVQEGGLVFVNAGFANNPNVNVVMELEGGEGRTIASIKSVEARAALIGTRTCSAYRVIDTNIAVDNQRVVTYSKPLSELAASSATCNADAVKPNVYYEFIFTVVLDNGQEIVTMPVRSIVIS